MGPSVAQFVAGMLGFVAGALLFSRVGQWVVAVYQSVHESQSAVRPSGRLVSALLLHSGPWLLTVAVCLAYYVRSEPWALSLLAGVGAAVLFFTAIGIVLALRAAKAKRRAA